MMTLEGGTQLFGRACEVVGSPWIAEMECRKLKAFTRSNGIFSSKRHVVVPFKDSTFQVVARSWTIQDGVGTGFAAFEKPIHV